MMTLPGNSANPGQVSSSSTLDVKTGSPNVSPQASPQPPAKHHKRASSASSYKETATADKQEKTEPVTLKPEGFLVSRPGHGSSSEQGSGGELSRSNSQEPVLRKSSERTKKKAPWYSALYPTYKSRSDDFKRIFKEIPPDERLVVDYSCAIQRDILAHGRLYVSQNYLSFYANIFRWETNVVLRWKDITGITKEKTALVIPNAILVHTNTEKHFLTSFTARDKAYLMLFRVWQNALMDQPMSPQEMWQWVHTCYGDELGLTSDDDDYVAPANATDDERTVPRSKNDQLEVFTNLGVMKSSSGPDQSLTPGSVDQLQSDLSDSSPSESESEKLGKKIICPAHHEGRLMLHMQLSIHVDQLFTHLFTNSKFFFDLHENRKSTDLKQSPWVTDPSTNQKGRTVSLTVQLAQAIGPKHAQVTESQNMLPCSTPGELYAIEIEVSNAGIPYADAFYIVTHYCLTRGADPGTSNLTVYSQIKYKKSLWGIAKSYIEKNCWSGMEEYFSALVKALETECERTRRAMAAGVAGTKRKVGRRRRAPPIKPMALPISPEEEKHFVQNIPVPMATRSTTDTMTYIVFLTLFILLVLNAALYYKLWGLENNDKLFKDPTHDLDFEALSRAPKNPEEWKNLLQKQELLHSYEIDRWLKVLKASVHLLQQVEQSLTALQASIQGMIGDTIPDSIQETLNHGPPDEL